MEKISNLKIIGVCFSVIGIAITIYTVFDGVNSSKNIQNAGWAFILIGFLLTTYITRKKK